MPLQPCRSEVRCGNGEMAKYHFLTGDDLAALDLEARVGRCVEIKAEVVASMRGSRGAVQSSTTATPCSRILNFRSRHAHGEGATWIDIAARLAQRLGRIDAARLNEHLDVVGDLVVLN